MDPVSIASAIASLLVTATKIVKSCNDCYTKFKFASLTLTAISTECQTICMALSQIDLLFSRNLDGTVEKLRKREHLMTVFDNALIGCAIVVSVIDSELQKLTSPGQDPGKLSRIKFLWDESTMQELLQQARGQQIAIQTLLSVIQAESLFQVQSLLEVQGNVLAKVAQKAFSLRESINNDGASIITVKTNNSVISYDQSHSHTSFSFDAELASSEAYKRTYERLSKKISKETIRSSAPSQGAITPGKDPRFDDSFEKLLVAFGAAGDANIIFDGGSTPLLTAAQCGYADTVETLLGYGGDPNYTNQSTPEVGLSPMHYAAGQNSSAMITALLNSGANIDMEAAQLGTPLVIAAARGNSDACRTLLRAGANVHIVDRFNGKTPLHHAVGLGDKVTTKLLLDYGAKAEAQDEKKIPVWHWAIKEGQTDILEMLLQSFKTCGVLHQELESTSTPLTGLQAAAALSPLSVISVLLKWGADPSNSVFCAQRRKGDDREAAIKLLEDAAVSWEGNVGVL